MKANRYVTLAALSLAISMTTGCAGMGEFVVEMAECYAGIDCEIAVPVGYDYESSPSNSSYSSYYGQDRSYSTGIYRCEDSRGRISFEVGGCM